MFRWLRRVVGPGRASVRAVIPVVGLAMALAASLYVAVDALMLRRLPYPEADRIVHLEIPDRRFANSPDAEIADFERRLSSATLIDRRAVVRTGALFDLASGAVPDWGLRPVSVTADFFNLFGVEPVLGRVLDDQDRLLRPRPVVLGFEVWRDRFGASPDVVGREANFPGSLRGERWIVVGVMPIEFSIPRGANFWAADRGQAFDYRPVVPAYAHVTDVTGIDALKAMLPELTISPLRQHLVPQDATLVLALLVCCGFCLLSALVQIAGLLAVDTSRRIEQLKLKVALGASPRRLLFEAFGEGAVVACLSVLLASAVMPFLFRVLVEFLPSDVRLGAHFRVGWSGVIAMCVVGTITGVALAVLPVVSALSVIRSRRLRSRVAAVSRTALPALQVIMSTALVYAVLLSARSAALVGNVDLGFRAESLVGFRLPAAAVAPGATREAVLAAREQQRRRSAETFQVVRQLPAVEFAVSAFGLPAESATFLTVQLRPALSPQTEIAAAATAVSPGFARTLGIPVLSGEEPDASFPAAVVGRLALVNESLAQRLEEFGPVIGQDVSMGGNFKVVGVVADARLERPDAPARPTLFSFYPPDVGPVLLARISDPTARIAIRTALARVWEGQALGELRSVEQLVSRANETYRAQLVLMAVVAGVTWPLAILGIVGAVRSQVALNERSFAIRLAIGATAEAVQREVVAQFLPRAAIAVALGLVLGVGLGRLMANQLFGIRAADVFTLLGTGTAMLLTVAIAAGGASLRIRAIELSKLWR